MQKLSKSEFMHKVINDKYDKRFHEKESRKATDDYCMSRNQKKIDDKRRSNKL